LLLSSVSNKNGLIVFNNQLVNTQPKVCVENNVIIFLCSDTRIVNVMSLGAIKCKGQGNIKN